MLNYYQLEQEFKQQVHILQKECKCKKLLIEDDNSGVGMGSIFPKIVVTCKICNKKYYIFRGSKYIYKTSDKIKRIIKHMISHNLGRCWLEDEFKDSKICYEAR